MDSAIRLPSDGGSGAMVVVGAGGSSTEIGTVSSIVGGISSDGNVSDTAEIKFVLVKF